MLRLIRNTFRLATVLAIIGAGVLAWTYYRSDELLRGEVLKQFSAMLPGLTITVERANYDLRGRVRIFDLSLRRPEEPQPFLTIAETTLTVDRQQLTDRQRVVIQQVRLSQPQVRLVRGPDGRWNFGDIEFVKPEGTGHLPDLEIAHGRLEVVLADHATRTMVAIPVDDLMLSARPSSRKSYTVEASGRTEYTGAVRIQGDVPLEQAAWSATAELAHCRVDTDTLRLATIVAPETLPRLVQLQNWLLSRVPVTTEPAAGGRTIPRAGLRGAPPVAPWDLGLSLSGRLQLQAAQAGPNVAPDIRCQLQIQDGQLTHAVLPSPLFDLRGVLECDSSQVLVHNLSARNGQSQIAVTAAATRAGGVNALVDVQSIPIDESLVSRLPESLQRHVRSLELTGEVSGQLQFQRGTDGRHQIDAEASLVRGSVRHERFPYLIRDIAASANWHHDTVQIQAQGLGGTTPVHVVGTIHHPGPAGDAVFDIRADNVPVDDALLQAVPPSVRKVVEELRFQGRGDIRARLLRPEGLNQKYSIGLMANVRDAFVQFSGFPYPISGLTGRLRWLGDVVTFEEMQGVHDGAVLTGSGRFELKPDPGRLVLNVDATNAAFDRALFAALPADLQEVWTALKPSGRFDGSTSIDWTVGTPVKVEVPRLHVMDATIVLRDFPYPFREFQGDFAFLEGNRVEIRQFSARHDDTRVNGQGAAVCHTDGTVTVRLDKLHVDDLTPTPALRSALPAPLRDTIEVLNPTGRYSFHGPVTLYSDQRRNGLVGAEWDVEILLAGCALNAGLRVDDIHGRINLAGRWTPRATELNGSLDLDALDVLVNHQITQVRGPFRLKDGVLIAGAAEMADGMPSENAVRVSSKDRISGQAFDGEVRLDAVVDLNSEPVYRAFMQMENGSLERYAFRHLRGYSNVRGLMNGSMTVRGRGMDASGLTGEGQMQISPAALYELPVFLQIFQLPQFAPIDRTAFNYARFVFRIENERFNFQTIDLVGNALSLRGRGVVRFDSAVMLDFFTMQPRNQVRIPGLREVVGVVGLFSQGWIAVEVRGPMAAPVARVVPFPAVDEALQQFLGAFDPRPPGGGGLWRGPPRSSEFPRDSSRE